MDHFPTSRHLVWDDGSIREGRPLRVVTASEMREIDRKTIEEFGVPSLDLMERAGSGAAQVIATLGVEKQKPVVIVCGKGNNGGDGFVAARYLSGWGANVTCWTIGERDEMTSDALRNLVAAEESGVGVKPFRAGESEEELHGQLEDAQIAVDALLGTGARGTLKDPIRRIARIMNDSGTKIYALDMPTGMNADNGEVDPDCVRSLMTITFGFPKRGLYRMPGRSLCGDVTVVDLGYPEESIDVTTGLLLWQEMRAAVPARPSVGHKGTFGRVLVVAGSRGMSGAACLAAEAGLRSGAGLVRLVVPDSIADLCETKLTEVMVTGATAKGDVFGPESLEDVLAATEWADTVLIGPGLSGAEETQTFVREFLRRVAKPVVLDADALNALAGAEEDVLERLGKLPAILTPHPGELGRVLDIDSSVVAEDSVSWSRQAANDLRSEIILKGAPTVIASPTGEVDFCSLGNDGMATAGSGDVLAGLVAGVLAQGADLPTAARLATMIHSRAGDICRTEIGAHGMLAGDILRCLPYAWRELEGDDEAAGLADDEDDDAEGAEETGA